MNEASESRANAHTQVYTDLKKRMAENPEPTEEELNMGAYIEEIEPQARDAIEQLRQKGYQTQSSGFYGYKDELQGVDGPLVLEDVVVEGLRRGGYEIDIKPSGYTAIFFRPSSYELDDLKMQWGILVGYLPDRGYPAEPGMNPASVEFREQLAGHPERFMQWWVYNYINHHSPDELTEAVKRDGYDIDLDYVLNRART